MENLNKYLRNELGEEQAERMTASLIQQKFDEESKKDWGQFLEQQHGITRQPNPAPKRSHFFRYVTGIAASLLLLIAATYWLTRDQAPAYQKMAISYTQSLPVMADQMAFRKGSQDMNAIRLKANEAFADQEYEKAILLWSQLDQIEPLGHFDLFYLGTSCLLQPSPDPEKAIIYLQQSSAISNDLQHETNWVLALAYLQDHQLESAKKLLEKIVSDQQFMVQEAAELLEALPKDGNAH